MTNFKNHKDELKKLYRLREQIRSQILGNDYYIAKELRLLEFKVLERIEEVHHKAVLAAKSDII